MQKIKGEYKGIKQLIIGNDTGHYCGYCQVPFLMSENIIYSYFDVHGGITYFSRNAWESGETWIGFDCAHAGDAPSLELMSEELRGMYEGRCSTGTFKDLKYVKAECDTLAEQIKSLGDK